MDVEQIRQDITDLYKKAAEAEANFSKALYELRNLNFPVDEENADEVKAARDFGKEIDIRTCFLLKALLVQHGNVLFL